MPVTLKKTVKVSESEKTFHTLIESLESNPDMIVNITVETEDERTRLLRAMDDIGQSCQGNNMTEQDLDDILNDK